MVIVPLSGCSKPAMLRRRVVLPQPGGPEQCEELVLLDVEAHVVDGDGLAEPLGQVPDREQGGAVSCHRSSVSLVMRWAAITMVKLTSRSKAARALISGVTPKRTME